LARIGARTPEQIDPILTAKELGIEVAFGHLEGAAARIFRIGAKARIRVSDRIVTMREGRVTGEISRDAATEEILMSMMTFHQSGASDDSSTRRGLA